MYTDYEGIKMEKDRKKKNKECIVDNVGTTSDTLTSRGGLTLFVRYINGTGIPAIPVI